MSAAAAAGGDRGDGRVSDRGHVEDERGRTRGGPVEKHVSPRESAHLDLAPSLSKNADHRDGRQADDHELRDQRQENEAGRRSGVGTALELVSETVKQEIDVDQLHNALAALLVSYYRKRQAEGAST